MIIRIKKHLLLILLVGISSYIASFYMIDSIREMEMSNALEALKQAPSELAQLMYAQDIERIPYHDYTYVNWLMVLIFTGLANGFYMVTSWRTTQKKSIYFLSFAAILTLFVGFFGMLSLVPLVMYELYQWLIKKEQRIYYNVNDERKELEVAVMEVCYANDQQAQLIKHFMRKRQRNLFVFMIVVIPFALLDLAFLNHFGTEGIYMFLFVIVLLIIMFAGFLLFIILQSKNEELLNTYLEVYDTALLKRSYEIIMAHCTNDSFNSTERTSYVNALLLNGDFEEVRTMLKGRLIARNAPVRWICEHRLAILDNDEAAFSGNDEKLRKYYQWFLSKNSKQKAMLEKVLLDLDIRKCMFYQHYKEALVIISTKAEPTNLREKVALYYQLGLCYYHLNHLDEAKVNFIKVQELSPTSALAKEISPLLSTLM